MVLMYKAHPWHGVSSGDRAPDVVNAYIEMVPVDTVKYEVDKETGHLKIDRPQKYSSQCPSLYGFVPRTFCGDRVGEFCRQELKKEGLSYERVRGDNDPLDICVITERPITHGDILVSAVPIGGIRMIDGEEADDKIIAILHEDGIYGSWRSIKDCPKNLVDRLTHYFKTYKDIPGSGKNKTLVVRTFDADTARQVIQLSIEDYQNKFS